MQFSVVTACWCLAFLGAELEITAIKGDGKGMKEYKNRRIA